MGDSQLSWHALITVVHEDARDKSEAHLSTFVLNTASSSSSCWVGLLLIKSSYSLTTLLRTSGSKGGVPPTERAHGKLNGAPPTFLYLHCNLAATCTLSASNSTLLRLNMSSNFQSLLMRFLLAAIATCPRTPQNDHHQLP